MVWFKGLQAAKDKNDDFKFLDELGLILKCFIFESNLRDDFKF
jgi:hypothetical protein